MIGFRSAKDRMPLLAERRGDWSSLPWISTASAAADPTERPGQAPRVQHAYTGARPGVWRRGTSQLRRKSLAGPAPRRLHSPLGAGRSSGPGGAAKIGFIVRRALADPLPASSFSSPRSWPGRGLFFCGGPSGAAAMSGRHPHRPLEPGQRHLGHLLPALFADQPVAHAGQHLELGADAFGGLTDRGGRMHDVAVADEGQ